jgi:type III secretion protein T
MSGDSPVFVLSSFDDMMRSTVIIASPVVVVMFLATLGLGFVNRTAPQLNVFFLSMPVKSALGIAFLIIYLPFVMDMLMYTAEDEILIPAKKVITN